MHKKSVFKSVSVIFIFTLFIEMFSGIIFMDTVAKAQGVIPKIGIVSLDHYPFKEGDKNSFFIASKEYSGQVEYQLFYTNKATMGSKWELINNASTTNGWTKPVDSKVPVEFDISGLELKSEYYRFAIRVRRAGVKGTYSNEYGDYDFAFPFTFSVVKNPDIDLSGDMILDKTQYNQSESIVIDGVKGTSDNTKYKLHIYDVKNNKWMTELTGYNSSINYKLNNLPAGYYVLDVWGKNEGSNKPYDGWKLKTIEVKKEEIPEIAIVSLDHTPFIEGDKNSFFIASKEYSGQVEYQLFYTNKATMGSNWEVINNEDTIGGWTQPVDAQQPITFDISGLNLKAEYYRFAIRVRRVGVKGKYSNQYGDYDFALPFVFSVVKDSTVRLNGDMLLDKTDYAKNDNLVINGVKCAASTIQYKLHLYDVKNNKWLTELTGYGSKIDYDLSNIPEGKYIVDIWAKNSNSASKYDGWKLKIININSEIKPIVNVDNITASAFRGDSYSLPKTVLATFQDGTKVNKFVTWDKAADTSKVGVFTFAGTVKGYESKAQLNLNVIDGRGNTSGNIINLGFVAESDGWIYYTNHSDEGKLYKALENDTNVTKLSDDAALYINVVGDWVYYCNISDNGKLYKIRRDGSSRTKISDDFGEQVTVNGEWAYYTNTTDNYSLYKIKVDGTNRKKLNNDMAINLNLDNDYIYYTNMSDNNRIYKVKIDGTGRIKINNDESGYINVVDGWIYYSNKSEDYSLYKIKTNGTVRTKLLDSVGNTEYGIFLNVVDGWIYYSNGYNGRLRKMRISDGYWYDISTYEVVFINLIKNYAYFEAPEKDYILARTTNEGVGYSSFGVNIAKIQDSDMIVYKGEKYTLPSQVRSDKLDGSFKYLNVNWNIENLDTTKAGEYILEGEVEGYNGKAYLKVTVLEVSEVSYKTITHMVPKGLYTYSAEPISSTNVVFSDGSTNRLPIYWDINKEDRNVPGNYTYEGTVRGYDGKLLINIIVVDDTNSPTGPILGEEGEWVYYKNMKDKDSIYRIKKDGTGKMKVLGDENYDVHIIDGWIYYQNQTIYKVRVDGTERTALGDANGRIIGVKDGWLYYSSFDDIYKLYRIDTQGANKSKIANNLTWALDTFIYQDYIYYLDSYNRNLYKVKNDGTSEVKLTSDRVYNLRIADDWMYYVNENTKKLKKIKADGSNQGELTNATGVIDVVDNWIYFKANGEIRRIGTDGSNEGLILSKEYRNAEIIGDWIYYTDVNNKIGKVKLDGTENTDFGVYGDLVGFYGDWIFYETNLDAVFKIKLDGTEKQIVWQN